MSKAARSLALLASVTAALTSLASASAADSPRDPLLTPLPPAPHTVHTWNDAASALRARSTDLAIAYADVAQAQAQSRRALASLRGQIRLDGSYTFNILTHESAQITGVVGADGAPTFETLTLPQRGFVTGTATATLPLIAPRAWVARTSARLGEEAANAQLSNVQRQLREAMGEAIVSVVVAERTAEQTRAGLDAALDRLDILKRKSEIGGGTVLDVVRGQQDLEAARALVVNADENVHRTREALGLALGFSDEVGVDPSLKLDDAIAEESASCNQLSSLKERADLVAAARRVDVAHQVVRDAHAQFLPTLSLQSALSSTTEDLSPYPRTTWYVQGLISWNLWDGGARYADLRSGHAQEAAAEAHHEQAVRNATFEVERARRNVSVAEAAHDVAVRETAFAADQERLTKRAFEAGQGTSLELVSAAASHRNQEIQLILREYDVVRARLAALFAQARCRL